MRNHIRRFSVGNVASRAGNSIAKEIRIGGLGQHGLVVVALDQKSVECFDAGEQVVKNAAQIGPQSEPRTTVVDGEGGAVDAIVRRGNGLNLGFAQ